MAMDEYEIAYTNLEYQYKKGYIGLPLKTRILNKTLYVVQILMVFGATMVISGALIAERNGIRFCALPFGTMEKELIYVPFACGAMSAFTAVIGCIGATVRNKWLLILYLICIGFCLILSIASTAQAFADSSNVYYYAQRQWKGLTRPQELQFQQQFRCCNFITKAPCCRFYPGRRGGCANEYVCFDLVSPHLLQNFDIIAKVGFIHSVYLFVVCILAVILYKYVEHNNANKDLDRKKENEEGFS